jgi:hypothetical protein
VDIRLASTAKALDGMSKSYHCHIYVLDIMRHVAGSCFGCGSPPHAIVMWGTATIASHLLSGFNMSRVIAVVACGLSVAACSVMPNLNFFKRSETTEALRFESAPPGAQVKTSSGQSCVTPCELKVQASAEFTATFTLKPYKPQTITVRPEMAAGADAPQLSPNPVYAELNPSKRSKPVASAKPAASRTANAASAAAAVSAEPTTAASTEPMPSSAPRGAAWPANDLGAQ